MLDQNWSHRLLRHEAGSVLPMAAAMILLFIALVGSALDLSVAYMARGKLQNACDAGVLAARQNMVGTDFTEEVEDEAHRFFDFNFPTGTAGVQNPEFTVGQSDTNTSELEGSATATVPTKLVRVLGYDTIDISVNCDAVQDMGHNDIVLVLDVTGSMNDAPSNGGGTKIGRLRTGAAGLYRAMESDDGSITRFSIVPYSHTVNVGASLRNTDFRRNNVYVDGEWRWRECDTNSAGTLYYVNTCEDKTSTDRPWVGVNVATRKYRFNRSFTMTGTRTVNIQNTEWASSGQNQSIDAWRNSGVACIQERRSVGESSDRINDTVTRADIDTAFSSGEWNLRFGIYDPASQRGHTQDGCPSPATRAAQFEDEAAFTTAINAATANVTGGTYHDVGMLWGTRFASRTGFFAGNDFDAGDNVTDIDTVPVNTHIIFMTDGMIDVDDADGSNDLYSAHGLERFEDRTGGTDTNVAAHLSRFQSTCRIAREMGITIWVIALDVTDTADISACATSDDHFFTSDGSDLEEVFEAIGQGIGRLRLTR